MNLINKSERLKKDADITIERLNIKELLGSLGKVTFVGSYALDLLYRPDIDIFVQSEGCSRDKVVELTKVFLDSELFQSVGVADYTKLIPPNNVVGFYWELIHLSDKYKWKFDIWYTPTKDINTIVVTNRIIEKLKQDPQARLQILKLKEKYYDGIKYSSGMNGLKIYEEVLGKI